MDLLNGLNEQQRKAVMHLGGPCLVLAGAGSGKTKVLTTRIAYLIEQGVPSYQILAITFTNKAAKEMKERLSLLVPEHDAFLGTFHSLGVRILRKFGDAVGLDKNFTILDSDDVLTLIKRIMKDKDIDVKEIAPAYIRNRISFIKNENLSDREIDMYFNTEAEKKAKIVYQEYQDVLKKNNSVDFDDLLRLPVQMFKEREDILSYYQEKFQYILVDEYQDTNEVQYQFNKLLAFRYQNLFVVGDANQSIYGFRNANFQNILNFEKDYPGCETILLDKNYRSTDAILNCANCVISHNKERKDLELHGTLGEGIKTVYYHANDDKSEIRYVLDEVEKGSKLGQPYSSFGILYRTNGQARLLEEMFLKKNIPYKVVGSYYFYQRKEIKDLLCYLKLILNTRDDISLRRVINSPKRGIGEASIEKLAFSAAEQGISMFDAISTGKELAFKTLMEDLIQKSLNLSLTELIDAVLEDTGMKHELESEHTLEADLRLENLEEFKSVTAAFEERTGSVNLDDFLEEISLVADASEHKEDEDAVTMMTIHSAKGLEFDTVFLVGMEEGIFPHVNSFGSAEELEEERRLCYVGITRAKKRLYLTNAKRRILYGREQLNPASRFIDEIDSELLDCKSDVTIPIGQSTSFGHANVFAKEEGEETTFKAGDTIMHTMFGKGVVVSVDDTFIKVAFSARFGVKKLLKNHKGIKKL